MKLSDVTLVTTAGTAVKLGLENINSSIAIKALTTNTGLVYVGNDGSDDVDSASGFPLDSGEVIVLEQVGDLESIYVDSDNNGEGVSWIKLNA